MYCMVKIFQKYVSKFNFQDRYFLSKKWLESTKKKKNTNRIPQTYYPSHTKRLSNKLWGPSPQISLDETNNNKYGPFGKTCLVHVAWTS